MNSSEGTRNQPDSDPSRPEWHTRKARMASRLQSLHRVRLTVLALLLGLLLASCTPPGGDVPPDGTPPGDNGSAPPGDDDPPNGTPPPGDNDHARITGRVSTINADIPRFPETHPLATSALLNEVSLESQFFVPGQLLVTFEAEFNGLSTLEQESLLLQGNTDLAIHLLHAGYDRMPALVELESGADTLAAAAQLEALPNVIHVQPNFIYQPLALPRDEHLNQQWPLPLSGVPLAWEARNSAAGKVVIAVLDSSFDLDHPDLQGVFVNNGYDFCSNSDCSTSGPDVRPRTAGDWHGTHVTGILAAVGNNVGISGVVNQGDNFILPVKVMYGGSFLTSHSLISGLRWAVGFHVAGAPRNGDPANIINLSLGKYREPGGRNDTALHNTVKEISRAGVLLIAASGNHGEAEVMEPAAYPEVIAVGSANPNGLRSCFSNYGPELDLLAGGGDRSEGPLRDMPFGPYPNCSDASARSEIGVLSTVPYSNYAYEEGTSGSAPVVSGIAALVWADLGSAANATSARDRLLDTAYRGGGRTGPEYGSGIVRADAALGFPGPGSSVTVKTDLAANTGSATLDLFGGSSSYTLDNLPAGRHNVSATAGAGSRPLSGSARVRVEADSTMNAPEIRLNP